MGVSLRGPSHAASGAACQDACAWVRLGEGGVALAVADGAGSAPLAAEGAATSARAAVAAVRAVVTRRSARQRDGPAPVWPGARAAAPAGGGAPGGQPTVGGGAGALGPDGVARRGRAAGRSLGGLALWPPGSSGAAGSRADTEPPLAELARIGCRAARLAVCAQAEAIGAPPRALATTLLLVVWRGEQAAAAHIGDGAAVAWRAGGWEVLSPPAESEYINETRFLTDPDWEEHVRIQPTRPGVEGVLAFSDGCQRAALLHGPAGWRPFSGFLDPVGRFAQGVPDARQARRQISRLLASAKLAQVSDDDKTLALIWRRAPRG